MPSALVQFYYSLLLPRKNTEKTSIGEHTPTLWEHTFLWWTYAGEEHGPCPLKHRAAKWKDLGKRMKQKHTYTQATEGKKCHWGAFNVKLYNWAGAEEDSVELNKVTTCIHFREENRQQDEECLRSHVHVCVCSASFHWQNILCKHPWHRQLLLCSEKLSFSMGLKGKEKKKPSHTELCGLSWADFPRPRQYGRAGCWLQGHSQAVHWSATGWTFLPHNSRLRTFLYPTVVWGASRNGLRDCGF